MVFDKIAQIEAMQNLTNLSDLKPMEITGNINGTSTVNLMVSGNTTVTAYIPGWDLHLQLLFYQDVLLTIIMLCVVMLFVKKHIHGK